MPANGRDRANIALGQGEAGNDRLGPCREELHRRRLVEIRICAGTFGARQGQWRYWNFVFTREAEPHPARDQHLQVRTRAKEMSEERRGLDDLLEVVKHEQDAPVAQVRPQPVDQRFGSGLTKTNGLGDGGSHQVRVRDRGQINERDAVWEVISSRRGNSQRQPGLAHTTRTGQREERNILTPQELAHCCQLALPANEWGARQRQD